MKRLVNELGEAQAAWQFVDSFNRLPQLDDCAPELRADAHLALRRLQEQGWPELADPARFPIAQERADMLAKALAATAPHRPGIPTSRHQVDRWRR